MGDFRDTFSIGRRARASRPLIYSERTHPALSNGVKTSRKQQSMRKDIRRKLCQIWIFCIFKELRSNFQRNSSLIETAKFLTIYAIPFQRIHRILTWWNSTVSKVQTWWNFQHRPDFSESPSEDFGTQFGLLQPEEWPKWMGLVWMKTLRWLPKDPMAVQKQVGGFYEWKRLLWARLHPFLTLLTKVSEDKEVKFMQAYVQLPQP